MPSFLSVKPRPKHIVNVPNPFNNLNVKIIALTSKTNSTLSKNADISLDVSIDREACPLNLAPTTSSMLTMSVGDALAIATMQARGFAEEDFALTHPGGSLGKELTEIVKDKMISENLPLVNEESSMAEVIIEMTKSRLGLAIVSHGGKLIGIITDGDLRRLLLNDQGINQIKAKQVMSKNPLTINKNTLMVDAKKKMQESKVQALVVLDVNNKVEGVIQIF